MDRQLMILFDRGAVSLNDIYNLGMNADIQTFTDEELDELQSFHKYVAEIYSMREKYRSAVLSISRDRYLSYVIGLPDYRLNAKQQAKLDNLIIEARDHAKKDAVAIEKLLTESKTKDFLSALEANKNLLAKALHDLIIGMQEAQKGKEGMDKMDAVKNENIPKIKEISETLLEQLRSEPMQTLLEHVQVDLDDLTKDQKTFPIDIILSYM